MGQITYGNRLTSARRHGMMYLPTTNGAEVTKTKTVQDICREVEAAARLAARREARRTNKKES